MLFALQFPGPAIHSFSLDKAEHPARTPYPAVLKSLFLERLSHGEDSIHQEGKGWWLLPES